MLAEPQNDVEHVRVAIVEDHPTLREGMRWMLESSSGFLCTGAYDSCEAIIEAWSGHEPEAGDVVLMDIGLPGYAGH